YLCRKCRYVAVTDGAECKGARSDAAQATGCCRRSGGRCACGLGQSCCGGCSCSLWRGCRCGKWCWCCCGLIGGKPECSTAKSELLRCADCMLSCSPVLT